ncbi:MFS transporter [Nonomuraea sp. B1E8]|uniref:MFS transporter n=1 Tax=unclassified Nonomuraea TaxID=2593643 RepID=UPI00325C5C30
MLADQSARPWLVYSAAMLLFGVCLAGVVLTLGNAPLFVPLAAVGGCCGPLVTGGLSSGLDDLVAPGTQMRARALDSASYNVAELAGPPAAATLATLLSATAVVLFIAGMLALAGLLALLLPLRPRAVRKAGVLSDLRAGLAVVPRLSTQHPGSPGRS